MRINLLVGGVTADTTRRTLTGTVYRYGEIGHTSAGPLGVSASFAPPAVGLPVTLEHDRSIVRGSIALVDNTDERLRVAVRVVDGALGDQALEDASSRQRGGFSLDIEDAVVQDGLIVSGRWEALGQVAEPAFTSARIDQIAASIQGKETPTMLTDQQRARLDELQARTDLTPEETNELQALQVLNGTTTAPAAPEAQPAAPAAAAATPVAASLPAVPAGLPTAGRQQTVVREGALDTFVRMVASGNRAAIQAAFTDVTNTGQPAIEAPAWSGELWSGLQYSPIFTPLLNSGDLTNWQGNGWRWVTKPAMQDYAGDKAAVPSGTLTTQASSYTAARMAVGHDFDRKFYDFPDEGFLRSYAEAVREDWAVKLDAKVSAWITTNAVQGTRTATVTTTNASANITAAAGTFSADDIGMTITGTGIPASTTITAVPAGGASATMSANATASGSITATINLGSSSLLKACVKGGRAVQRNTRAKASFYVMNDEDYGDLIDVTGNNVPAFLDMFGVDPANFVGDAAIPVGTVYVGVKNAATVRTLPGSPIRVDAQHLANGGIDSAFFGYWAVEQHHTTGVVKVTYKNA